MLAEFIKEYKNFIIYVFWGAVSTLVNVSTFLICTKLGWHYQAGNVLAWLLAVLVTYFSNKFLVFKTKYNGFMELVRELASFFVVRLFALFLDMVIIWFGMKVLNYSSVLVKVFDNIIVGIANYVVSRWIIFVEKKP